MPKRLQKAVLVKTFVDYSDREEYYNELTAENSSGEWMDGDEENDHLIHPDCDEIILEPGALVVLERWKNFTCERWGGDGKEKATVWKIIQ